MTNSKSSKKKRWQPKGAVKPNPSDKGSKYHALLLALLSFVLYGSTIGFDFAYDDVFAITENYITQQGWQGLPTIWTEHYRYGFSDANVELYRPIPLSLFAFEWSLSPNNPGLHHFINVLFYALTAFSLFYLIKKVFRQSTLVSFLACILFVAHPLHTEVVANIKSRDEILALLFLIVALRFLWKYIDTQQIKTLAFALIAYLMALFSKESAITYLAIFPLTLYFCSQKSLKEIIKLSLPFVLPAFVFLLMRYNALGTFGNNAPVDELHNLLVGASSLSERLATAFLILGKYLGLLIFPHSLNSDAGFGTIPLTSWTDWKVILSVLAHLGLVIYAFGQLKKRHFLSFCILFYGITISLNTNLLLVIGSSYGERFLFTPSLAYCLAIAYLLGKYLPTNAKDSIHNLASFFKVYQKPILACSVIFLLYSFKTINRNPAWIDSLTLTQTDLLSNSNSVQLNYNYGVELLKGTQEINNPIEKNKNITLAKNSLNKAVQLYPTHAEAYGQLGLAYYLEGNNPKAMDHYKLANHYKSNDPRVYNNMAMIHYINKDLDQAQSAYEKAISLDNKMDEAYRNLAGILLVKKDYDNAIQNYKTALSFDPDNAEIHYFMGLAYQGQGDTITAIPLLEKAYAMDPTLRNQ